MNHLKLFACTCAIASVLCSCSSRRTSEGKKNTITGLTPATKNPSVGVINASGDALTPGINSTNRNGAGSQENATQIANNAIVRANAAVKDQMNLSSMTGRDFIDKAMLSDDWEIKTGMLAMEKSANIKIRDYATMVLKDHREIREALQKLGAGNDSRLSDTLITSLQSGSRNIQQAVMPEAGSAAFDASYITMTIQDHRDLIRLFEAAGRAKDETLSAFAKKYLPLLRQHLAAAQELTKAASGKP